MTKENRNPKTIHVDYEEKMSLVNAATFLESIANKLKNEKKFILTHNGHDHDVVPSDNVTLEIKLEERNGKHKLELELEWREADSSKDTSIQIG